MSQELLGGEEEIHTLKLMARITGWHNIALFTLIGFWWGRIIPGIVYTLFLEFVNKCVFGKQTFGFRKCVHSSLFLMHTPGKDLEFSVPYAVLHDQVRDLQDLLNTLVGNSSWPTAEPKVLLKPMMPFNKKIKESKAVLLGSCKSLFISRPIR